MTTQDLHRWLKKCVICGNIVFFYMKWKHSLFKTGPGFGHFPFWLVGMWLFGQLFLLLLWHFKGADNYLGWDVASELHKKLISRPAFSANGLQFSNNELVYYIKSWYLASAKGPLAFPVYFLLLNTVLGLSLVVAALSRQKGLWFLASVLATAGFLLTARLEVPFQQFSGSPFLMAFGLLGGLLFLFNSFWQKPKFGLRFSIILLTLCGIVGAVLWFGKVSSPLLAITHYGLIFPIVAFGILVFLVAHEVIGLIIFTCTAQATKGKSSLRSYFMLSGIYLLNCLLIYLENQRVIDHSTFLVGPIWLYLFSIILGFWGFRKQTESLGWFSFWHTGFWIYSGLTIIGTALLAYALVSGNDPLVELLKDYISSCHLAVGLVFFVHILINFITLFKAGQAVERVMYKPKFSRLLLARIAALTLVGFLMIQNSNYSFRQLLAALHAAKADYYWMAEEYTAAETYYKESAEYDYYNHKANFALGTMAGKAGDATTAAHYFKRAIQKNPSEQAFAALSQHLENEDLYFEAIFNLRQGLVKFPQSAALATGMARLMEKAEARDSLYVYLNKAKQNCSKCPETQSNLLAFWIENARIEKLDSIQREFSNYSDFGNVTNHLAMNRLNGYSPKFKPKLYTEAAPSAAQFAALYNQLLLPENKENYPDSLWNPLIENTVGAGLNLDVLYLKAMQTYRNDQKISAFKQLTYLAVGSSEFSAMYRQNLAIWYLKEGLYNRALEFLKLSGDESSVSLLANQNLENFLMQSQKQQAEELKQFEITVQNSQQMINKAPFNPYWLAFVADFLVSKKEINLAYTAVLNALEFNEHSSPLWKKYVALAYKNNVPAYAKNGEEELRKLLDAKAFEEFMKQIQPLKMEMEQKRAVF